LANDNISHKISIKNKIPLNKNQIDEEEHKKKWKNIVKENVQSLLLEDPIKIMKDA
jgi:hypothetical protein